MKMSCEWFVKLRPFGKICHSVALLQQAMSVAPLELSDGPQVSEFNALQGPKA